MLEINRSSLPVIAEYADESGRYTIRADSEFMCTTIDAGPGGVEEFVTHLIPEGFGDFDWSEWKHTDRFASCPDIGGDGGAVLIDGSPYSSFWADDVYLVSEAEEGDEERIRAAVAARQRIHDMVAADMAMEAQMDVDCPQD